MEELFKKIEIKCQPCQNNEVGKLARKCYACHNDLVGQEKHNHNNDRGFIIENLEEVWECHCEYHECRCGEYNYFYCPICDGYFKSSEYLEGIFRDEKKTLWIANMVTHHRHNHITSWNKRWDGTYKGSLYQLEGNYEEEKQKVNEQAKRVIASNCKDYMKFHNITTENLLLLKNNEEKTIEKWKKLLG